MFNCWTRSPAAQLLIRNQTQPNLIRWKAKATPDASSQPSNMSAPCMNHVDLLWLAVLCAKCKWCFLFPPGVSGSPDSPLAPVVMVMEAHSGREGPNTLGFPPTTPPPIAPTSRSHPSLICQQGIFLPTATPSASSPPPLPASVSLQRQITPRSRPQRPCHAPLLASSHHSGRVAAYPSTHWLSSWRGSGWQPLRYWWGLMAATLGEPAWFPPAWNPVKPEKVIQLKWLKPLINTRLG